MNFKLFSKKIAFGCAALILAATLGVTLALAQAAPGFLGGNIMTATNNSSGSGAWSDPVSGNPGEVVEFRVVAQNQVPGTTANNVKVTASLPSARANPITASATVSADNASSMTDTATVNVNGGSQQGFAYIPGHVRVFSGSCPSGCAGPDSVTSSGVPVGNLGPGESAQVLFKAYITNIVPASPSPSPSPSPAATAAPVSQGGTVSCPAGFTRTGEGSNIVCVQNQNQNTNTNTNTVTVNPTMTQTQTVQAAQPAASVPAPVRVVGPSELKELPKTGLPLVAWGLAGLLPVGAKLRKFGKIGEDNTFNPSALWFERQVKE